jgi:hypothetical protein
MRLRIETPIHSAFIADTLDRDPDLEGDFDVLTEDGETLRIHGWMLGADDIEVLDATHRPAGWYAVAA